MTNTAMNHFAGLHGKKLEIGDRVAINPESEYYHEWRGEYIVIGIQWNRERDQYNINIAESQDLRDGGADEWELDDLKLVREK
jgi:hypothetical protein